MSASRTGLDVQQHVPAQPTKSFFPQISGKMYPLSEEKEAPLPGVGIRAQTPVILPLPYLLQCGAPRLPLSCTREEEAPQIPPSFLHGTVLYPEASKAIH